jgi:hypothetical protein
LIAGTSLKGRRASSIGRGLRFDVTQYLINSASAGK